MILSVKDVMLLLDCSENTAAMHLKGIRKQFQTKYVTKWHMAEYLCVDFLALEASYQYKVKKNFDLSFKLIALREATKSRK